MTSAIALASAVVRAWVFVYTAGAAAPIREARRQEIASDLWEHARAGAEEGLGARAVAGQMLARCFLGIGADLSWRVQVTLGQRRAVEKEVPMSDVVKRNWWIPAPILMIGCGILVGLMSHGRRIDMGWDPSPLDIAGGVALAGLVFVVLPILALLVRRSHPGWTFWLLAPGAVVVLSPLLWLGDAVRDFGAIIIVFVAVGILTLVGALTNLAQASVAEPPQPSSPA